MFEKLRDKWRKSRESKARRKAAFNAIENGTVEGVKKALDAVQTNDLTAYDYGTAMKRAIDRQDLGVFKQVLIFADDPNTTIRYEVSDGRYSTTYTYAPISYALEKVRTHDISMLLANNPRTTVSDSLLQAAKKGGMSDVAAVLAKRIAELRRQEAVLFDNEAEKQVKDAAVQAALTAPAPVPAAVDAVVSAVSANTQLAPGESWALMSKTSIAHVTTSDVIGRKMTEIFNFESRDRVLITENLKTGAESIGAAEPFAKLGPETVRRAEETLKELNAEMAKKAFNL